MTTELLDKDACCTGSATNSSECFGFIPNVDVLELSDELQIRADLPGVTAEQVHLTFEDGTLALEGRVEQRQNAVRFLHREYEVGNYHRSFEIGDGFDIDRITAKVTDGVLTVHLPKREALKPRRIAITN